LPTVNAALFATIHTSDISAQLTACRWSVDTAVIATIYQTYETAFQSADRATFGQPDVAARAAAHWPSYHGAISAAKLATVDSAVGATIRPTDEPTKLTAYRWSVDATVVATIRSTFETALHSADRTTFRAADLSTQLSACRAPIETAVIATISPTF